MTFRLFLIPIALLFSSGPVAAQELLPDAPKEMQDFRLDEPAPKPQPTIQPTPATDNLAAPSDKPQTPAQSTTAASESAPQRAAQTPKPRLPSQTPRPETAPAAAPPPAVTAVPSLSEPNVASDVSDVMASDGEATASPIEPGPSDEIQREDGLNTGPQATMPKISNGFPDWLPLALIAAGFLVLLGAVALFKRRQSSANSFATKEINSSEPASAILEDDDHSLSVEDPALPEEAKTISVSPAARNDRLAAKVTEKVIAERPRARPELEMRFIPDSATLGLMNLTLRGELKIVNIGKAMARNVILRSSAICACDSQKQLIDGFFNDTRESDCQTIENIRKGERLSVSIETVIPRAELSSYAYQGREICIPITLNEIRYTGMQENSGHSLRLSAMIGCEATPPVEKLGPLRLDLGPRSFGTLGHRMINA